MTKAMNIVSCEPLLAGDVQATDNAGVPLYKVHAVARTSSGTKLDGGEMIVAASNAADIRQFLRAWVNGLDDEEKKVKPKTPKAIADIVGIAVDTSFNPVTDW